MKHGPGPVSLMFSIDWFSQNLPCRLPGNSHFSNFGQRLARVIHHTNAGRHKEIAFQ